jgi:hypothetical protein
VPVVVIGDQRADPQRRRRSGCSHQRRERGEPVIKVVRHEQGRESRTFYAPRCCGPLGTGGGMLADRAEAERSSLHLDSSLISDNTIDIDE